LPRGERDRAERLQRALDGHLDGRPGGDPAGDPSGDGEAPIDGSLLRTARTLQAAADDDDRAPSASFVLALEEQLRTDLRLGLTGQEAAPERGPAHKGLGSLIVLALAAAVLVGALWGAGPMHPLYEVRLRVESAAWTLAGLFGFGDEGLAEFGQGRRLLADARVLVEGRSSDGQLDRILRELPAMYSAGANAATRSLDQSAVMRAHIELQAAAAELARLGGGAAPAEREIIEQTREALTRILSREQGPVAALRPDPPAAPPTPVPSPRAALPTEEPTSVPRATAPPPTATAPPPTREPATDVPPTSVTPAATSTRATPPPTRVPDDPSPPAPSPTSSAVAVVSPTISATPARATPTLVVVVPSVTPGGASPTPPPPVPSPTYPLEPPQPRP
jgi:hypothetical protein